jgi:hypothetical protein
MKRNAAALVWAVLLLCCSSCKKDIDRKLLGSYKGTALYSIKYIRNPADNTDTLYTDVIINVSEGTESSRKEIVLSLSFSAPDIRPPYSESIPVSNGVVNYTATNRGAAATYYRWNGTITADSLKLVQRTEYGNGNWIWYEWEFKAKKQ